VGLGLAIVDAIATAHGGRCSVEPRERGTLFALHLPVGAEEAMLPGAELGPVYAPSSAARSEAT
jgi:K+-sensing histidine kinase KdpD